MNKKILIVNKFFYPRGGDCLVAMGLRRLLQDLGMEVRVYAMDYPANDLLPESSDFAPQVDFSSGIADRLRGLARLFGGAGVRPSFRHVLREFKPDVVWAHNIHSYLSPAVMAEARAFGARTLWTMHDYKAVCPSYLCLDGKGRVCTSCVGGSPTGVITHGCMHGSRVAGIMAAAEAACWTPRKLQSYTDLFICPSQFLARMMEQGGYDPARIKVVPNFLDPDKIQALNGTPAPPRVNKMVYIGRLSREKGIGQLLETAASLPWRLDVYGGGELEAELRSRYAGVDNIRMMGHADAPTVAHALRTARLSIISSVWYENNPLSVIESLSAGTPVVGSRIGGIPELLENPADGVLFEPGDTAGMAEAITMAMSTRYDHDDIAMRAMKLYSRDAAVNRILPLL